MVAAEWRGLARFWRRQWPPTVAAIAVVGVAIALSAITFELADAGLWRDLPYKGPSELAALTTVSAQGEARVSVPDFLGVRERVTNAPVAAAGAFVPDVALTEHGEPLGLKSRVLSAGYFATLGVTLVAGREFTRDEERLGAGAVVIVTDSLWQRVFERRSGVVGESLMLNGRAHTIVGVLPPMRDYLGSVDLYLPLQFPPTLPRRLRLLEPIVRVPPGAEASVSAAVRSATSVADDPDARGHVVQLVHLSERISAGAKNRLWALFLASLALLVVAVANIAAVVLARAEQRASEFSLRRALGAPRRTTLAVAAMDAAALTTGGAALALVLTAWFMPIAGATWGPTLINPMSLGGRVLVWIGLAASVLLGASILSVSRATDVTEQAALRPFGRRSLGRPVVVGQLALATSLVVAAVALSRQVAHLAAVDPGFEASGLYVSRISLPATAYPTPDDRTRFWDALVRRLHDRGIEAAVASELPLTGEDNPTAFAATSSSGSTFVTKVRSTSPGYLQLMRVALDEGRYLAPSDRPGAEWSIVVNRAMALALASIGPALGQRLSFDFGEGPRSATIVGIVRDIHHTALGQLAEPEVYFTAQQTPLAAYSVVLSARRQSDAREALAEALGELDRGRPFAPVTAYADIVGRTLSAPRSDARLIAVAATAATLVASAGLYALVSLLVTHGAREWAIRLAVGASPAGLQRSLLLRTLVDLASGALCGAGIMWAIAASDARIFSDLRVESDVWAFVLAVTLIGAAGMAAVAAPAMRMGRIAPADLLRR